MYFRKEKYWKCFPHDIIAENYKNADFLFQFLKFMRINKLYLESFEIVDVRRYRLIKKWQKVDEMLKLPPSEQSFIFPVNLN